MAKRRRKTQIQTLNNAENRSLEMDYEQIKQNFLSEIKAASKNEKSSLSFIKNVLSQKPLVSNGVVQAIVIGGTNYVSSVVKVENGKSKILKTQKGRLPVFKTGVSFSSFINEILNIDAQALGINFAFPLNPIVGPNNELDGILLKGTKEHTFSGLIGHCIGETVRKVYFEKFEKLIPITVANDSVCLTLAGTGSEDGGVILGTGFNMSLKITDNGKKSIVNLEAGNFNCFKPTEAIKKIDALSEYPSKMLFEKSVSGRYLVDQFNIETKIKGLKLSPLKTSEDLSILAETNSNAGSKLAYSILEKSAFLIACALAGIYEFKRYPAKMEFITEGSLFWKGWKFEENVKKQLTQLGVPKNAIKFKFVEDSSLKGAIGLLTLQS